MCDSLSLTYGCFQTQGATLGQEDPRFQTHGCLALRQVERHSDCGPCCYSYFQSSILLYLLALSDSVYVLAGLRPPGSLRMVYHYTVLLL
jgi:hypothetical protein